MNNIINDDRVEYKNNRRVMHIILRSLLGIDVSSGVEKRWTTSCIALQATEVCQHLASYCLY